MVRVTSEVGRLRQALVHEPGPEVDRMVPAMMEQLLFDDILYGDRAREEHARFRRVLQHCGVELFDAADLLLETLEIEAARDWVFDVLLEDVPRRYRDRLRERSPLEIRDALVAGVRSDSDAASFEPEELYGVTPLPNWCFQRDTQVVSGNGVIFCSMAAPARHRETLLTRASFRFHPMLKDVPVVYDPLQAAVDAPLLVTVERPYIEGGDVLILSPEVIVVGLSERTNVTGIRSLAEALAKSDTGPRWMVVVGVPRRRAYMHLDTVITQVDHDACLVYPPVILPGGAETARVWKVDLHAKEARREPAPALLDCLRELGIDLEPIPCGGADPVAQQREQWTDGANALAVAPGLITLFERNLRTVKELDKRGWRIVDAENVLLGREELDADKGDKVCVTVQSHEISRARGGPHCLTHPLQRD